MEPAHDDERLRPLSLVTDEVRQRAAEAILERRPHDAAKELTLLASLSPRDLPVWLQLGHQRVLAGQPAGAAEAYLEAAGLYAKRGHGRRALTVARRALQLHVAACTAVRLDPIARSLGAGAAGLVEQAARGHLLAGRPESARRLLAMLLEVDPASVDRRFQLAEVQLAQGAWMDAVQQLHLVADGLRAHGRIAELVHVAEMALRYGGPDASLLRELAAIYRRTGQRALAEIKLEQLHRLVPDDRDALEGLSRAAAEAGKIEGALQHLESLVLDVLHTADRAHVRAVLARAERWSSDGTFSRGLESLRVRALVAAGMRRVPPPPPRRAARPGPTVTFVCEEISASIELC